MIRKIFGVLLTGVFVLMAGACSSNNEWNELSSPISAFVTRYFPFSVVQSYSKDKNVSTVILKYGPKLTFNASDVWLDVDGRGDVLPEDFLFDQLPDMLYDYLESMEELNMVYRVNRADRIIDVYLANDKVQYDELTMTISE
ncbi:MAG: hypothetical protein K2M94_05230 [Paramuribaculum sp.]|nr:hypothetical protein [Paramuribaculum sp.]